ncbi:MULTISPECIES: ABC transporter permease [Prochlorococcus]|uniref:ABC-type antimicrobial peptide transport system permease component n=1 Tax=Prochlorococcus marinus (strain SARG / CCMP1375 / SS120) TaxID=167539 RepID=Q7VC20_PROMA|nr:MULTISPECIES: ABC transporter permease [Prochlorococcus]AAP99966.1 ABC-type antimicrobial peptide transport system permease component [Prochlorococcus marinus subsp. marinus str. CCMP1375]KGG11690.1 Cell division protein FtsX [Prochlorococcus marinus str. LG]KGG18898.1 Cell division protein FtsX [Prochlorococcus marinus str. SS2]KGG23564.1 Cell division protein FtsX [Prochlorococcus marinus str. SS35]KGG32200.1 Cell division protein FtsX [Prochlorococcus marinus str. SS51]
MGRKVPLNEIFLMSLKTLKANKLRSSLTMLGIIIGNASVITLLGVGKGAQKLASNQLSNLGANVLFVVPGNNNTRRRGVAFPRNLTLRDAIAIEQQVPTIEKVAPQISSSEVIQYESKSFSSTVLGVTPDFLQVRSFDIAKGRFISEKDNNGAKNVAIIGHELNQDLFNNINSLGKNLRIKDQSFQVIGVMEPKGAVFGSNQDKNIYIPLTTMVNRITGKDPTYGVSLSFISIQAKDARAINAAKFQITNLLRQRHNIIKDDDFAVRSQKDALSIVSAITGGLTLMLAAIGGISLFVGGIGIMNIMLVSVSERTEEIGLRKAIGAREADIMLQFLTEALVLAVIGGILGAFIGLGSVNGIALLTSLPANIELKVIMFTVSLSGSIGLIFGVLPAKRASKLDPIVALRSL